MHELIVNLHMHTVYSDGHGSHHDIARAAIQAGLDAVIVTDHNIYVQGLEGYFEDEGRRVLVLVGEEIHDQSRQPQKNHLLVLGIEQELSPLADDLTRLLNTVQKNGGLAFIAHPVDPAAPAVGESDLSWVDWQAINFTGIELWNGMSEFKSLLKSKLHALWYAFNPHLIARGPFKEALEKWEELLATGQRVVVIGGSDAHALPASMGPLHRILFPYEFHFKSINTHIISERPLIGDMESDSRLILNSLARGRAFIGYDLPVSTRGFRFTAHGFERTAVIGEEISSKHGVTFQIRLPQPQECNLLRDGKVVQSWKNRETCTYITSQPGVYRVEAYLTYWGRRRGWIFSNPIYVR